MRKNIIIKLIVLSIGIFLYMFVASAETCNAAENLSDGTYTISSAINSDFVLDITGASTNNSANLEIWKRNGGTNQKFVIKHISEDCYTIKAVHSNKYLDVEGGYKYNGANILQYGYHGEINQQWIIKKTNDGYYSVKSKCNGLNMDVAVGKMSNGTNVITWSSNGAANQKFKFELEEKDKLNEDKPIVENAYVEEGTYKIVSAMDSGYALDVPASSKSNGANISIWSSHEGNNQKFYLKRASDGYYEFCSVCSNKYMDVENGSKFNGANVLQYQFHGADNQKWILNKNEDGSYNIISKNSGLYIDIAGGMMANGTNVLTWAYNGAKNQRFKLVPTTITVEPEGRSAQFKQEHPDIKVGIDVSKYQGTVDWNAVKKDGIDYVMVRAGFRGYGSAGSLNEDPKLDEYVHGARAAGLDVGIYFFSQATNYQEGVEEANYTIGLIRKYDITYPVAFDTEDSSSPTHTGRADGISTQARTDATKGFCSTIKNAGYKTLIYASPSWIKENLYIDQLSEYDIWLANYTGAEQEDPLKRPSNYKGKYVMWQYTDSGTVNGIKGKVDCDLFYYLK